MCIVRMKDVAKPYNNLLGILGNHLYDLTIVCGEQIYMIECMHQLPEFFSMLYELILAPENRMHLELAIDQLGFGEILL